MKEELNIAAILKDKPNTKLWSPIVGQCTFKGISSKNGAIVASFTDKDGEQLDWDFNEYGKTLSASKEAEVCLFPSKEMRSWEKFAWKKGDVLCCDFGKFCIFDKWANDQYAEFYGRYPSPTYSKEGDKFDTESWSSGIEGIVKITFIKKIEERYGGKLNLETLRIEQPNPEFKDGGIIYIKTKLGTEYIIVYKLNGKEKTAFYVAYNFTGKYFGTQRSKAICRDIDIDTIRPATDSEKQQLIDALAKKNKAWDEDKKMLVDLSKKCEFEAFQKVMVRDSKDEEWRPAFFWRKHSNGCEYVILSGEIYNYCLPYNDSTKHLLGTTDEWKGGK